MWCRLASSAAASHSVEDMERELSPELMELREALLKLRAGRQCDIDVIRLLELYERFHDKAPRLLGYHGRRHRHAGGEAGTGASRRDTQTCKRTSVPSPEAPTLP